MTHLNGYLEMSSPVSPEYVCAPKLINSKYQCIWDIMFFCHKNYYAPCHSQHKKKISPDIFIFVSTQTLQKNKQKNSLMNM